MKNQRPQKINSQKELDDLIRKVEGGYPLECFVLLNFGIRSSKDISLNENNDYQVYNEIDDSEETIVHSKLMSSFIGKAISKGALYKY
jgi:hypothetical protein